MTDPKEVANRLMGVVRECGGCQYKMEPTPFHGNSRCRLTRVFVWNWYGEKCPDFVPRSWKKNPAQDNE